MPSGGGTALAAKALARSEEFRRLGAFWGRVKAGARTCSRAGRSRRRRAARPAGSAPAACRWPCARRPGRSAPACLRPAGCRPASARPGRCCSRSRLRAARGLSQPAWAALPTQPYLTLNFGRPAAPGWCTDRQPRCRPLSVSGCARAPRARDAAVTARAPSKAGGRLRRARGASAPARAARPGGDPGNRARAQLGRTRGAARARAQHDHAGAHHPARARRHAPRAPAGAGAGALQQRVNRAACAVQRPEQAHVCIARRQRLAVAVRPRSPARERGGAVQRRGRRAGRPLRIGRAPLASSVTGASLGAVCAVGTPYVRTTSAVGI